MDMSVRIMSEELDEDSVFFRRIESNSDICSNCYRRVRYTIPSRDFLPEFMNESNKEMHSDEMEYDPDVDGDFFDDQRSGRPSVFQRYCPCGAVDLDLKLRPMDKDEVMDVAQRIEKHLLEQEVEFDIDTFYDSVRSEKSNPDNQFNEEKIFEVSIERAISENK